MSGFKVFADGNVLTAAELNGYLMRQAAMRFPTTADITANLPSGVRQIGMLAWADDTQYLYMWDGTNWVPWASPEKTYFPAFTAGGTNVTIGNGVLVSKWRLSGGFVRWTWSLKVGSTSNLQSGNYALGLPPVAIHGDHSAGVIGQCSFYDASLGTMYSRSVVNILNTTNCAMVTEAGVRMSTSSPIAPAVDDVLLLNVAYRPTSAVLL